MMSGIILLSLFNISHFSSTVCSAAMAKPSQQESCEERVTAQSRPMMSLIARAPSALSSTASERPGKTRHESQSLLSMQAEKYDRTGRPVVCPQVFSRAAHQFVIEDDETESELSLGSRSFLHRVNDQLRKRQKQSSMDATEDSEVHSVIWECSCLQHCKHLYPWEELHRQLEFHQNYRRSHNETDVRHI